MTEFETIEEDGFVYLDMGPRTDEPLLLLHGLFGTASNFDGVIRHFSKSMRVILPVLPIFEMPMRKLSVGGLVDYVCDFIGHKGLKKMHVLGNSLGGHIALLLTLRMQEKISSLTLTGSSGLFEDSLGTGFPRREDYEYIKNKIRLTFYDPGIATKEMVDEVFGIVNNRLKALRIVKIAKSAIRHNVGDRLDQIDTETLLVWGNQDTITPPFVGEKFKELLKNSRLVFLDKCGHAPMLELPGAYNEIQEDFFKELSQPKQLT
ncbi:MAG: alpha/beta fold hydrolase [Saprospiraceae bacterium]|nr:alpha/beta fold hydrolase [Saprospiraceae bacterium]